MSQKDFKLIVLYFTISLASLFLILWLANYSKLGLPEIIPQLQLRTYGILILIAFLLINFLFQKKLLKANPEISIFKLIAYSVIVIFFFIASLSNYKATYNFKPPFIDTSINFSCGTNINIFFFSCNKCIFIKKIKKYRKTNFIRSVYNNNNTV